VLEIRKHKIISKADDRGVLSFVQNSDLPFQIKRAFWIDNVNNNITRGEHAHHKTMLLMICLKGSCDVYLDNGKDEAKVRLKNNNEGILINPMIWHKMQNFKDNCLILVLASEEYDEGDYIRSYAKFKEFCLK
jgi:dTDP-4-dehydrorhamnose 3,5-epimerase-like enzyme